MSVDVKAVLRFSDLFWMWQDTLATRFVVVASAVLTPLWLLGREPHVGLAYGAGLAFCGLVLLPIYGIVVSGALRLRHRPIWLNLREEVIDGWPVGSVRHWDSIASIRRRPGVIVLQFGRLAGSGGGRIVIPLRGVDAAELPALERLLSAKGFPGYV